MNERPKPDFRRDWVIIKIIYVSTIVVIFISRPFVRSAYTRGRDAKNGRGRPGQTHRPVSANDLFCLLFLWTTVRKYNFLGGTTTLLIVPKICLKGNYRRVRRPVNAIYLRLKINFYRFFFEKKSKFLTKRVRIFQKIPSYLPIDSHRTS